MTKQTRKRPNVLQLLLIALFLYGSVSYGLSLLEYTLFQTRGVPLSGSSQPITHADYRSLVQRCGSQLLPAAGIQPPAAGESIMLRCGRFWPFYRYTVHARQSPETLGLTNPAPTQVRLINHLGTALAAIVIGFAGMALYQLVIRRRTTTAYRWSFLAFGTSLVMVGGYVGLMFWADPHFGLGW